MASKKQVTTHNSEDEDSGCNNNDASKTERRYNTRRGKGQHAINTEVHKKNNIFLKKKNNTFPKLVIEATKRGKCDEVEFVINKLQEDKLNAPKVIKMGKELRDRSWNVALKGMHRTLNDQDLTLTHALNDEVLDGNVAVQNLELTDKVAVDNLKLTSALDKLYDQHIIQRSKLMDEVLCGNVDIEGPDIVLNEREIVQVLEPAGGKVSTVFLHMIGNLLHFVYNDKIILNPLTMVSIN